MRTQPWDRDQRIAEVRDKIWAHISPTAKPSASELLVAAGLLGWPENDVYALARVQFMLSTEVTDFLLSLPQLTRRLTTATTRDLDSNRERLRGPVVWGQTMALRATSGQSGVYVTAPARRVFQTAENELLVHVLDGIVGVGREIAWPVGKSRLLGNQISDHVNEALRWQQSRMLREVRRTPPTPRTLARITSGRAALRYEHVVAAYERHHSLIEDVDRDAVREAVEKAGLVTADEPTLFELLSLFGVLDGLKLAGWRTEPMRLLSGRLRVQARRDDGRRLECHYQGMSPSAGSTSRYLSVLAAHGFKRQPDLRPDIVLSWQDEKGHRRRLLVECKLSQSGGVETAARRAAKDLLMYRRAFGPQSTTDAPYGLGIAWGAGLTPNDEAEIVLCTPDTIASAISLLVR